MNDESYKVKKVNHGKVFGSKDWFTYYCGKCGKQLDSSNIHNPCSCGAIAIWKDN